MRTSVSRGDADPTQVRDALNRAIESHVQVRDFYRLEVGRTTGGWLTGRRALHDDAIRRKLFDAATRIDETWTILEKSLRLVGQSRPVDVDLLQEVSESARFEASRLGPKFAPVYFRSARGDVVSAEDRLRLYGVRFGVYSRRNLGQAVETLKLFGEAAFNHHAARGMDRERILDLRQVLYTCAFDLAAEIRRQDVGADPDFREIHRATGRGVQAIECMRREVDRQFARHISEASLTTAEQQTRLTISERRARRPPSRIGDHGTGDRAPLGGARPASVSDYDTRMDNCSAIIQGVVDFLRKVNEDIGSLKGPDPTPEVKEDFQVRFDAVGRNLSGRLRTFEKGELVQWSDLGGLIKYAQVAYREVEGFFDKGPVVRPGGRKDVLGEAAKEIADNSRFYSVMVKHVFPGWSRSAAAAESLLPLGDRLADSSRADALRSWTGGGPARPTHFVRSANLP